MIEINKKEMIDAFFDHATEGIIVADEKGVIILVNPSAERMFGYEHLELIGTNVDVLVPLKSKHSHKDNREKFAQNPHARPMGLGLDLYGKRKDDSLFPVEISLSPVKRENNTIFVAFIIDISIRKQIEASVLEKQKELEHVASVLMATNEELERKVSDRTKVLQEAIRELEKSRNELSAALEKEKDLNDLKSRFISMASHEFRTPLTTILSSASLISEYNTPEFEDRKHKHVNRIKSAVNNLNDILSDFLSISKLEEGKVVADFRNFDLQDLIKEIIGDLQITARQGQKIVYSHTGKAIVYLDSKLIRNILINLLSNAIKFTNENKTINVRSLSNEEIVSIEVEDQGIGISEEDQKHLFERFYRGKNATNIQGTGLGLHIVGNFADLMRGHIVLSSLLNKGTIIKITFPNQSEPEL
jgi:PAS domain S-box-containing protein